MRALSLALALSWLEGKVTPGIQHPRYYNVAINGPVADALGSSGTSGAQVGQKMLEPTR